MNLDYILSLHCVGKKKKSQGQTPIKGVFGVKIDTTNSNPETALTYTDDAIGFTNAKMGFGTAKFNYGSWQDKFPFNQIKPCVLKNGIVQYYLNPNDYTKKLDGTVADITSGNDGDVMVEFPKIYWKFERIGTDLYVRYSDIQVEEGFKCLAHMRGTEEKDRIYISAYLGYLNSSKMRSLSGKTPTDSKTIDEYRNLAQINGVNYQQMTYYSLLMLQVLYTIMFKNLDSQSALGDGFTSVNNTTSPLTGSANTKGLFYGESTGTKIMKFCGIEEFYGQKHYFIDGIVSDINRNMLISNSNFNTTGTGYVNYGQASTANIEGIVKDVQGTTETGFIVKSTTSNNTTYYCDYTYWRADRCAAFGGLALSGKSAGAFNFRAYYDSAYKSTSNGSRLSYL